MTESLKIRITIAGRAYPIRVKNEIEEQGMRKAAQKINELVSKFEKDYAVSDKQDVLAMCALQFASLMEIKELNEKNNVSELIEQMNDLNAIIEKHLK